MAEAQRTKSVEHCLGGGGSNIEVRLREKGRVEAERASVEEQSRRDSSGTSEAFQSTV